MATTHQATKSDTDQRANNEAATRRWIDEVENRRNATVVDELMSPDFEAHSLHHNAYLPSAMQGRSWVERIKHTINQNIQGLDDRHTTIDQMIASADTTVAVVTITGMRQGKQISYTSTLVTRFVDGKMVEGWQTWDRLGFYQQLGVVAETPELMKQAGLDT